MNISHIRYIAEIEKTGSITKAAANLFMGQPNLSKAVRELENELGIKI
ncbi:MAG: LysR family transcriptional regulator, partial [Ruminococcus sp.]|nr:LysR family transcriptional regulator [Ruminococcus sp.]